MVQALALVMASIVHTHVIVRKKKGGGAEGTIHTAVVIPIPNVAAS